MKKIFLAIFLGLFPLSAFAFSDIKNSEFREFVENMANEKLISGYSDGTFRPNNSVSFFEALKISTNTTYGKQEFPGSEQNFYENFYRNSLWQNEKHFSSNDKISRDFAVYLVLKNIGVNLENIKIENTFNDVNPNSIFSNYINFARYNNIVQWYSNGTFWPNNNVTRGEFAKLTWGISRMARDNILENYQNLIAENKNFSENIAIIPQNNSHKNTAIVISVSDGDTIKVQNPEWKIETLRILGFDAPESFDTRFGYVECYGKEASDFLKKYLPVGTNVEIIYHGNDKYNRDLAEIFVNGESLAKTMLKNGYGWVYRGGIEPSNYAELLEIEKSLYNSNVGLWASHTCNGARKTTAETPKTETKPTLQNNIPKNTTTSSWNPEPFQKEFHNPGCHIKWNINSKWEKIYHVPTGKFYSKTEPEACFNTEQEARNAGFRPSKQ